jgi:hypothetical protein
MSRTAILFVISLSFASAGFSQTMSEFGAVAAGSTIGAAGGKGVSNGINSIFGKVDQQTAKAAGTASPAMKVAPGVPKDASGVPAPPPPAAGYFRSASARPKAPQQPAEVAVEIPFTVGVLSDALPGTPLPPPPTMTREKLEQVQSGMDRAEVLKLGLPSSKIVMNDGGHLVETYSYFASGSKMGTVRLTDGAVTSVQR